METTRRRFDSIIRRLAVRSPRSIALASMTSSAAVSSLWRAMSARKSCKGCGAAAGAREELRAAGGADERLRLRLGRLGRLRLLGGRLGRFLGRLAHLE